MTDKGTAKLNDFDADLRTLLAINTYHNLKPANTYRCWRVIFIRKFSPFQAQENTRITEKDWRKQTNTSLTIRKNANKLLKIYAGRRDIATSIDF